MRTQSIRLNIIALIVCTILVFLVGASTCKKPDLTFDQRIQEFISYYSSDKIVSEDKGIVSGIMHKAKENAINEMKLNIRAREPIARDGKKYYPNYTFLGYKYDDDEKCKKAAQYILGLFNYTDKMYDDFLNGKDHDVNIKWGHFVLVVNKKEIYYLEISPERMLKTWPEEKEKFRQIFMDGNDKNSYLFEYWPVLNTENFNPHQIIGGNNVYLLERNGKSYIERRKAEENVFK